MGKPLVLRSPIPRRRSKSRRGPPRDRKYLAWIRSQPCFLCAAYYVDAIERFNKIELSYVVEQGGVTEAAHVGRRGLGQKCSDRETLPLCGEMHHRLGPLSHHVLGKRFWKTHNLDRDSLIVEFNRRFDLENPNS